MSFIAILINISLTCVVVPHPCPSFSLYLTLVPLLLVYLTPTPLLEEKG
jgi:hypothetical protein